ncbi:MAG: DUF5633 domain-containing protein, partial [Finegoldia magna]|uniref:DUF5633 domain-containing protein n=1 Tax=Finegoldia magna TaxID=1260 RepID=UPI00290E4D94
MKINKKLLMAALAGAIVVGGGVNTYAADEGISDNWFNPADHPFEETEKSETGDTDPEKDPEKDPEENNENGYSTEAAAKAAAEEALKNDSTNKSYTIS